MTKPKHLFVRLFAVVFALALVAAACGSDDGETVATDEPTAEAPDAEAPDAEAPDAEEPDAEEPDAEEPDAEGSFSLVVDGREYLLAGPPGGLVGALPPDEVFLWKYNFDTGIFEQDGDEPAPPFDPSPRTSSQDWQIGWSNPLAAIEFSTLL